MGRGGRCLAEYREPSPLDHLSTLWRSVGTSNPSQGASETSALGAFGKELIKGLLGRFSSGPGAGGTGQR